MERLRDFENRLQRRQRIWRIPLQRLRDRQNPLEWFGPADFKLRYHMFKETAVYIASLISEDLSNPLRRGVHIPPVVQFLAVLRFYANGGFQISNADHHQVTQATISHLTKRVSKALAKLRPAFIQFPQHGNASTYSQKFYDIAGFPGIIGAIDCTHIHIVSPGGENAELFRNRKGRFSINVQAVCDADLNFTNVVARWYGSAHDSRIFENSLLFDDIESRRYPGILVGDGGYPLLPYLMTPFEPPNTDAERRYNTAQIRTRNTVERAFGVLKRRYPCLKKLRLKLNTSLLVIVATFVLHNITRRRNDLFQNDLFEPDDEDDQHSTLCLTTTERGKTIRATIVANHFS